MRLGIRVLILLALGALLAVGFVPLYAAVAKLTEASLAAARRDAARDLGRAVAAHVLEAKRTRTEGSLDALLEAQLSEGGVSAIAVFGADGAREATAGDAEVLPASLERAHEEARAVETPAGQALLVVVPDQRGEGGVAVTIALARATGGSSALVRLVALYTGVVALALLVFTYFVMTRLVVRPLEDVSRAASRVAGGARNLEIGRPAARELAELADSLREMTDKLIAEEKALRTKVEELERAKRDLENAQESVIRSERLASVGKLAAGVAHEIGNPIAAILGFEELLLAGDLPADEQRDFLVRMKKETERVSRVLRDLLDFARAGPPSAGERARGVVSEAIELVTALLKPQKNLQAIELGIEVDADLPPVSMSIERLQQVLLNLLLNAIDVAGARVEVRARREGDTVVLTVSDDGPGVPADIRGRLFEPFVTTKEVGKGTGLGLAVCRGLVEAAGGTIVLEDTDRGARFRVTLPAVSPGAAAAPPPRT